MKTLGERFKWRREQLALTQEEAAKAINSLIDGNRATFTRVTISNIENGIQQSMKDKVLIAVTSVLKCSADWLINGRGPIEGLTNTISNTSEGSAITRQVPLINWVQAASLTEASTFSPRDYQYLPCPEKCGPNTFALKVEGDSMLTRFEPGDTIYVDPELVDPDNGKFVIASLANTNELALKQFQIIDNQKFLKALNPDYPSEMRYLKINGGCEIIGTVICHVKPV
ncbi:helix-turn-helix domain-containing protein [Budvicia aquatica]|uniref:helix-turn-helix domain-containing protein n=1 Tax=Budvicia aquatica TaxID=82979 RepID=UPI00208BE85D|nr:S24 family peptidase [Budvicia aquatica]GKX50579.1 prophage repressor CohE [Budvicia aquatica]